MNSYFKKYLKYKNKYLTLRNLYGGVDPIAVLAIEDEPIAEPVAAEPVAAVPVAPVPVDIPTKHTASRAAADEVINSQSRSLMLLSEIANYTRKIYFSNVKIKKMEKIKTLLDAKFSRIPNFLNDETKYMEHTKFCQDSMIQLYDNTTSNYINLIHSDAWKSPETNIISPENILKANGYNMIDDISIDEMKRQMSATRFNLKCWAFLKKLKNSGVNFIEPPTEIVKLSPHDIFFPLEDNYINIKLNIEQKFIRDIPAELMEYNFIIPEPTQHIILDEQIKGGNFIASPPTQHAPHGVLFYINPITDQLRDFLRAHLIQPIVGLTCSFMFLGTPFMALETMNIRPFRHIDEIMTFLPYGRGIFKVWMYNIIEPKESYENYKKMRDNTELLSREEYIRERTRYIRDVIPRLRLEQRNNLDTISLALFGSNYENNRDKFFIIPIDVGEPPYLFPKPPIFNLTYIETREESIPPQLFLSSDSSDSLNPMIITELGHLRSYITNRPIEYHIINTNIEQIHIIPYLPGGNLHCLIKQEM